MVSNIPIEIAGWRNLVMNIREDYMHIYGERGYGMAGRGNIVW